LFVEVPQSASGITWVHENALSPSRYLPEALGRVAPFSISTTTVVNCDAIGAKIYWTAAGTKRFRLKNNGGSYLSSHDPREVLGIGSATRMDELEIYWPPLAGRLKG
jgi:hypothetical protein